MTRILDELPEWQEIQQKLAENAAAERTVFDRIESIYRPFEVVHAEWVEAMTVFDGKGRPPEEPQRPNVDPLKLEGERLRNERQQLTAQQKRVQASLLPEVERIAVERIEARRARVIELLRELSAEQKAITSDLRDVGTCRTAEDAVNPNQRPAPGCGKGARTLKQIGFEHLVAFADGADLLALRPMPSQPETKPHAAEVEPFLPPPDRRPLG